MKTIDHEDHFRTGLRSAISSNTKMQVLMDVAQTPGPTFSPQCPVRLSGAAVEQLRIHFWRRPRCPSIDTNVPAGNVLQAVPDRATELAAVRRGHRHNFSAR